MKSTFRYRLSYNNLIKVETNEIVGSKDSIEYFFSKKRSKIKDQVEEIDRQIALLYTKREELQKKCRHLNSVGVYKGNTGNYCPGDDRYWVEITCFSCFKRWTEDQ